MADGFGAGFFAITLLAILAGLAMLTTLLTLSTVVFARRGNHVPQPLRYLTGIVGIGVLALAGFGILVLYDEGPAAAWLIASVVGFPFLIESLYLARTTALPRGEVFTTTVMAWSVPFFLGVIVVFAVMNGIESVFELAPAKSRQLRIAWIASTVGGDRCHSRHNTNRQPSPGFGILGGWDPDAILKRMDSYQGTIRDCSR